MLKVVRDAATPLRREEQQNIVFKKFINISTFIANSVTWDESNTLATELRNLAVKMTEYIYSTNESKTNQWIDATQNELLLKKLLNAMNRAELNLLCGELRYIIHISSRKQSLKWLFKLPNQFTLLLKWMQQKWCGLYNVYLIQSSWMRTITKSHQYNLQRSFSLN